MFQLWRVKYKNNKKKFWFIIILLKFFQIKGLGETYYELANQNIKNSNDDLYMEHIESSIKVKTNLFQIQKNNNHWKIQTNNNLST